MLILLAGFLMPYLGRPREAGRQVNCMANIKQITLAILNYEQEHGTLPPAYICDKQGRPIHSWRVLILPYLGEGMLYSKYKFDEPWDGPSNSKLLAEIPGVYRCPSARNDGVTTNYVAVVGSETAWPGARPRKISEIAAPGDTILVVETVDADIPWAAPRDLELATLPLEVNPPAHADSRGPSSLPGVSSRHPGEANVGLADGMVRRLPNDIPPEKLRRLLDVSGPRPNDRP